MDAHIGILPKDVLDALSLHLNLSGLRFFKLPHPRTGIPSLFLPYASPSERTTSVLEVQAVVPPNARSWFVGTQEVVADGKLLLMTQVDPTFLLIPVLRSIQPDDATPGSFRQLDDIVESAIAQLAKSSLASEDPSTVLSEIDLRYFASLDCFKTCLLRICDHKEITSDIHVYRFSIQKLVEYLHVKVERIATPKVFECCKTLIRGLAKQGLMEDGKEALLQLGRVRASCDLLSQYLPPDIRDALIASYDLSLLNDYLKKLEGEEAASLAIAQTNASKKSKKTDTKDGQKRKAKASQGAEKLKRANVNGMAKISSFFKKT